MRYINQLKMNINTYGINETNNVFRDGHIWMLVNEIEDQLKKRNDIARLKEKMILYLSALEKSDWERSKQEIKKINSYYVFVIISIISLITCIVTIVFSINNFVLDAETVHALFSIFLYYALVLILNILPVYFGKSVVIQTASMSFPNRQQKPIIWPSVLFGVVLFASIAYIQFVQFQQSFLQITIIGGLDYTAVALTISFVYGGILFFLSMYEYIQIVVNNQKYLETIFKIDKMFEKKKM